MTERRPSIIFYASFFRELLSFKALTTFIIWSYVSRSRNDVRILPTSGHYCNGVGFDPARTPLNSECFRCQSESSGHSAPAVVDPLNGVVQIWCHSSTQHKAISHDSLYCANLYNVANFLTAPYPMQYLSLANETVSGNLLTLEQKLMACGLAWPIVGIIPWGGLFFGASRDSERKALFRCVRLTWRGLI